MTTTAVTPINEQNMRQAIAGVQEYSLPYLFSLIAELNAQGYTDDATTLQGILTNLETAMAQVMTDVQNVPGAQ